MFIKIRRAILVELLGPTPDSNFYISLEQSYIEKKLLPQKGLLYLIGEAKCLSPTSNYPFVYLKIFQQKSTQSQTSNYLSCQVLTRSQAYIRSWLVYSKC